MMNSVLQSAAAMRPTRTSTANSEGTGQKRREGCHGVLCEAKGCPFFFSSRRRHTRCGRDCSSDVCSSDLELDRKEVYLTNAVKHFKWEPRGKRRLHKKPNRTEVVHCRPWLEAEIRVVEPKVIVCLGEIGRASCRERV